MLHNVFADEKLFVFFTSLNRTKVKQWHSLGHTRFCLRAHGYVTDQIIFFPLSLFTSDHLRLLLLIPLCNSLFFWNVFSPVDFSPILIPYNCLYSLCWCCVNPYQCILPSFRMYSFNSLTTTNNRNVRLLLKNCTQKCFIVQQEFWLKRSYLSIKHAAAWNLVLDDDRSQKCILGCVFSAPFVTTQSCSWRHIRPTVERDLT